MNNLPPYKPPKLAQRLLKSFCAEEWLDEVMGDLEEQYREIYEEKGKGSSRDSILLRSRSIYSAAYHQKTKPPIFQDYAIQSRKNFCSPFDAE